MSKDWIFISGAHFSKLPCTMLRYFVLLAVAVAVAHGIVCPPNFCDSMECEDLTECRARNGYKVREKGSFCQCCDLCVKVLGVNDHCMPEGLLHGVINTAECAPGHICDPESRRCVRIIL